MSDKPNFPEFEDEATVMSSSLNQHASNSNPFVQQEHPTSNISVDMHAESTMVMEGPNLHDETTQIHDALSNPIAPIAKLYVQEGVQKDKSYPLIGDSVSFGREKDNAISHPDLSVSRKHFIIHNKNGKFHLEDLGSSGGTLINNKKVSGTQRLQHGDRIQVGKTLLQFQMLDESAQSGSKGTSGTLLAIVGLGLVLIIGVSIAFFISQKEKPKPIVTKKRVQPVRQAAKKPKITLAQKMLEKGVRLKTEGKLLLAKSTLEKAKMLSKPGQFTHLQSSQLLSETMAEIEVNNMLGTAETRYNQKRYNEAKKWVERAEAKLPIGSTYAEKVWSLAFKVRLKMSGKGMESELKRANKLIRRRRYKEALALLGNLQRAVDPGSENAQMLIQLTELINKRYKPQGTRRSRRNRYRARSRSNSTGSTPNITPIAPIARPRISQGLLYFTRGNLEGAEKAFQNESNVKKAQQVKKFKRKYVDGLAAYTTRNPAFAIPTLSRAYELDRSICGNKSVYTQKIKTMLSNMLFAKGREAMQLRNFNGYASAFTQFRRALQFNRKHFGCKRSIKLLRTLAEGWLGRAKELGQSNQARRFLRNVQRVVYKHDPLYKSATQQLKQSSK